MEQIAIDKSGVATSLVGLGTWAIGGWMWGGSEEAQSIATISSAVERGITLIDTAPVYGFGHSDEIVGKALAEGGLRSKVQIATKVGLARKDGKPYWDSSPQRIRQEIEDRFAGCAPISLTSIRCTGPISARRSKRRHVPLRTCAATARSSPLGVSNYSPAQMDAFRAAAPSASPDSGWRKRIGRPGSRSARFWPA
jgi:aryl-alcohol dehydrogenase-like predicted oxidoreductase